MSFPRNKCLVVHPTQEVVHDLSNKWVYPTEPIKIQVIYYLLSRMNHQEYYIPICTYIYIYTHIKHLIFSQHFRLPSSGNKSYIPRVHIPVFFSRAPCRPNCQIVQAQRPDTELLIDIKRFDEDTFPEDRISNMIFGCLKQGMSVYLDFL